MKPVLVLGFYDKANLGDEMFKETLPKLLPDFQCIFSSTDAMNNSQIKPYGQISSYQAIICGGGDIFNDYFMKDIQNITQHYTGPVFALGIGIPYPSYLRSGHLQRFDQVFLRETTDLPDLTLRLGARYVHFLPDLGFLKPSPSLAKSLPVNGSPVIGVFLAQSLSKHPQTIDSIIDLLRHVHQQTQAQIRMIRFNTSKVPHEDDAGVQAIVQQALPGIALINDLTVYTTDEIIKVMSKMDLAICSRFHAHIFATIAGCPFISITPTRKVDLYLKEHQLSSLQVRSESSSDMVAVFDQTWADRQVWPARLRAIAKQNRELLLTGQVNALLHQMIQHPWMRRSREDNLNLPTDEAIYQSSRKLLFRLTGFDLAEESLAGRVITRDQARQVSAHLCFEITRIPGSKYEFGTTQNIMTKPEQLRGMIEWIRKDLVKSSFDRFIGFDLDYYNQDSLRGLHRSGWGYVLSYLRMFQHKSGLLCDTYVDRTFLWGNWSLKRTGVIPYTSLWIGFIHHTHSDLHSDNNAQKLLQNLEFRQSLPTCRVLICLSDYLTQWFQDQFKQLHISVPVVTLYHPTLFVETVWSGKLALSGLSDPSDNLAQSEDPIGLINIGAWYRNPFTIYQLNLPGINKKSLRGPQMEDYFPPDEINLTRTQLLQPDPYGNKWVYYLSLFLSSRYQLADDYVLRVSLNSSRPSDSSQTDPIVNEVKRMYQSVEIIPGQTDQAYDELLAHNVVFLNLIDASASNTIIECIARNTPILLNRHPASQEYLGSDYPLFYDHLDQIPTLLTRENIQQAHEYLLQLDKRKLRIETFIEQLSRIQPLVETFQEIELL